MGDFEPYMFCNPGSPFAVVVGYATIDHPEQGELKFVILQVETPTGSERFFLDHDRAVQLGQDIIQAAKSTKQPKGLYVAERDTNIFVPGEDNGGH